MVLKHPVEGVMLFDTGYDPAFFAATQTIPEKLYRLVTPVVLPPQSELIRQLERLGIDRMEVRHLVLSHFHGDHVAGAHHFPKAIIHCAKAGLAAARAGNRVSRVRRGYLKSLIPNDIDDRAKFFEDAARVALPRDLFPFETAADLLGDGSVLAIELPGHCPGHWGLLVAEQGRGSRFMVADAAWSGDAISRNVPPPAFTSSFLGDTGQTRETLTKLHDLRIRNPDIRLTPCHCPKAAEDAEKIP